MFFKLFRLGQDYMRLIAPLPCFDIVRLYWSLARVVHSSKILVCSISLEYGILDSTLLDLIGRLKG